MLNWRLNVSTNCATFSGIELTVGRKSKIRLLDRQTTDDGRQHDRSRCLPWHIAGGEHMLDRVTAILATSDSTSPVLPATLRGGNATEDYDAAPSAGLRSPLPSSFRTSAKCPLWMTSRCIRVKRSTSPSP